MSEVNIIEKLYDFGIDRQEMIKHGFSAQKFDDVQRGKSSYNIDDLILISETFDLSLDYLVGRIPKSSEMLRSPHKETLTRKNACCPFCGSNNIWATIQTIISCSRKQPVYSDGIDCIDNDNEGDEPISGNTLGEMISSQFGEITSANYYLTMFNCDGCGKKWGRDYGEYEWKKGESGLYSFVKREKTTKRKKAKDETDSKT